MATLDLKVLETSNFHNLLCKEAYMGPRTIVPVARWFTGLAVSVLVSANKRQNPDFDRKVVETSSFHHNVCN